MIQTLFHRLGLMLLVVLLQVFVLNHINLWGYAVPLLGVVVLFYLSLNTTRIANMFMAFFTGLVLDAFSNSPGVAAGAMTLTAFVQYPLLRAMVPKDTIEESIPDMVSMGKYTYISYMAILMMLHHLTYFLLEAFTFSNVRDLLLRFLGSYIVSFLLALAIELLRTSRHK